MSRRTAGLPIEATGTRTPALRVGVHSRQTNDHSASRLFVGNWWLRLTGIEKWQPL
jgi:hypothetical protein